MANSTSARIARDRGVSGFFAFLAALPALAAVMGLIYVGYTIVRDQREDLASEGGYLLIVLLALFAFLFFIVARWTYDAVKAALTPQRVQAMWLRRFQSEGGDAFRTSRVIDRLSRDGVSALTLQDRDVKLSFEQRRNRLAPVFWFFFIPIAGFLAYAGMAQYQNVQEQIANQHIDYSDNLGEAIGQALGQGIANGLAIVLVIIIFVLALMATTLLIFLITAISGPMGAMFAGKRDEFAGLPRLLERLKHGKGRRGASIVRISDANWREAVTASLGAVDVAIIDLTNVSENVAWEIGEAVRGVSPSGLVFMCCEGSQLSNEARAAVRGALGREPGNVVHYPAKRGGDAKRFARALRAQIYDAADLRGAMKG